MQRASLRRAGGSLPSRTSRSAEGEGFEPSRPLSQPSALALRCLQPLEPTLRRAHRHVAAEGEGLEPPWPEPAVFETAALPVRLTLRFRSRLVSRYSKTSRTSLVDLCTSASGRTRTCTTAPLKRGPLPIGLPKRRRRATQQALRDAAVDSGGTRTLISWVQTKRPPGWTTDPCCHSALREGVEPSSPAFGGPCSHPVELPQHFGHWSLVIGHSQRALGLSGPASDK